MLILINKCNFSHTHTHIQIHVRFYICSFILFGENIIVKIMWNIAIYRKKFIIFKSLYLNRFKIIIFLFNDIIYVLYFTYCSYLIILMYKQIYNYQMHNL